MLRSVFAGKLVSLPAQLALNTGVPPHELWMPVLALCRRILHVALASIAASLRMLPPRRILFQRRTRSTFAISFPDPTASCDSNASCSPRSIHRLLLFLLSSFLGERQGACCFLSGGLDLGSLADERVMTPLFSCPPLLLCLTSVLVALGNSSPITTPTLNAS